MSVYIEDGAANSQPLWTDEALLSRSVAGVIISPFCTPWTARPSQLPAQDYASRVASNGGEVILDATTHGVSLPATNSWTNYNTWDLWDGSRGDLTTATLRDGHVQRVFDRQTTLGAAQLTPTVALDNAVGADADMAFALAEVGRRLNPAAWQSLAGRRGFWLSPDLDNYVGAIQQLEAPVWVLTHVRESVDYPADASEIAQTEAFCRTVDSLSRRSRVIVSHGDLAGLPAVAAGAEAVGTGWHSKQRVQSTASYQANDPNAIRRSAIWFTYEGLVARLHTNESSAFVRQDLPRAVALYAGNVSTVPRDIRLHHLAVVDSLVRTVDGAGPNRADRVATLRALYENAALDLDDLGRRYGRAFVTQRVAHIDSLYEGLRAYATAEGFWA